MAHLKGIVSHSSGYLSSRSRADPTEPALPSTMRAFAKTAAMRAALGQPLNRRQVIASRSSTAGTIASVTNTSASGTVDR